MRFAEALIITGPTVGFVIGTWWSRNRVGGIVDTRNALAAAQRQNARLTARLASQPSEQSAPPARRLQLVREDPA